MIKFMGKTYSASMDLGSDQSETYEVFQKLNKSFMCHVRKFRINVSINVEKLLFGSEQPNEKSNARLGFGNDMSFPCWLQCIERRFILFPGEIWFRTRRYSDAFRSNERIAKGLTYSVERFPESRKQANRRKSGGIIHESTQSEAREDTYPLPLEWNSTSSYTCARPVFKRCHDSVPKLLIHTD